MLTRFGLVIRLMHDAPPENPWAFQKFKVLTLGEERDPWNIGDLEVERRSVDVPFLGEQDRHVFWTGLNSYRESHAGRGAGRRRGGGGGGGAGGGGGGGGGGGQLAAWR
jgi:uncharacterized membrane protein YgcG